MIKPGKINVLFLIAVVSMTLYHNELKSQHIAGISLRSGYGRIGEGDTYQSYSYGSAFRNDAVKSTKAISAFYGFMVYPFLELRTEISLNRYSGSENSNTYNNDPHYPSYESSYSALYTFYTTGLSLYADFKIKKTHLTAGITTKYSLYGKLLSFGQNKTYDYNLGYITNEWYDETVYGLSDIFMYGYTFGISQEVFKNLNIELSMSKYKIKTPFEKEFPCNKSAEFNLGFYYFFDTQKHPYKN